MAQQSESNSPGIVRFSAIENRNSLTPTGFRLVIDKIRGVDFFAQKATLPSISLNPADTYTRFNKIPQPGDEIQYSPLELSFLVDENMKNWYQVHDWMKEIGTPYSSKEFKYKRGEIESENKRNSPVDISNITNQWTSDASLFVLSSQYRPVAEYVFRNAWPSSLTGLPFDTTSPDDTPLTAQLSLLYSHFDYYIYDAATATDDTMETNYRRTQNGLSIPGIS